MISGQESLNLEDCVSLAFKHNIHIRNAVLAYESSKDMQKEAFTSFFPNVNISGVSYIADKGILATELMPGMDISLLKKGIMGGITATQPLYTGGRIINSNKMASIQVASQKIMIESVKDEIQQVVEQYYWQYISCHKKLETLHILDELTKNTRKEVEALVKSGITTTNSLLEVQLKENELINSKLQVNNNLKHLKMLLGQSVGMAVDSFVIADPAYNKLVSPDEHKVIHENALYRTISYRLNEKTVNLAQVQIQLERGKYMPSLAVGAGYLYHNLLSRGRSFGLIYATISIPVSQWWGGSYAIKRRKREEQIAKLNMENTNELLLIQMQQYYDDLDVAYSQIEISQKSIETALEHVRMNTEYFKTGTITLTTLLDSQSMLQHAYDQYVEKYTEYLMKLSKYKQLTKSDNQ